MTKPKKQIKLKIEVLDSEARFQIKVNGVVCSAAEFSTCRNVYVYKDLIIKICRPSKWRIGRQTKAEIKLWKKMADEDRVHFVPLVSWGKIKLKGKWTGVKKSHWVAQPYLVADDVAPTPEQVEKLFNILDKYEANRDVEIDDCEHSSGNGVNCLMHEGMPKVYDWGINKFTKRD